MKPDSLKILTIAIPTFNGSKTIGITLESVLSQLNGDQYLMSKTEIVVSDNCSQDNVENVVNYYIKQFPAIISYFRNETNLGFDRNVDLSVRRASGKFVWILSDDDFLKPGAIEYVMNSIEKHRNRKVALIYINYANKERLKHTSDELCNDGNQFFKITKFKSGLISSNIVAKSIWMDSNVEQFFNTGWIHFGYDLKSLNPLNGNYGLIIYKELVQTGGEMKWGSGGTFIYTGFRLVEIFRSMPSWGYSRKTKKMADFVIKKGYLLFIPLAKAKGIKTDISLIKQFITLYKQYPSFWLIDLPLLLIPGIFYYYIYVFQQKLKALFKRPHDIE